MSINLAPMAVAGAGAGAFENQRGSAALVDRFKTEKIFCYFGENVTY